MSTEVFGFDCVPSFSSGESSADGQGFSHRSRAARRRETLTGSLPVCIVRRKTKARRCGSEETLLCGIYFFSALPSLVRIRFVFTLIRHASIRT
jgi:hypothetical protein